MPSKKQHDLLSKSDIAKALGMTSQTFSNRQSRDDKFPAPTYSNRSGSVALYTPEDAKKVYEYCTRAERERLQRAEQMFASLTSGDAATFEDVELFTEANPATEEKAPEAPAAEVKTEAPKAEEKPAPAKEEAPAKVAETDAEKAAKAKATADKIKAADAKIAEKKAAAAPAKTQAPASKTPQAATQAAADKNDARRIANVDNNTGLSPKAPASKGNGAAFGVPQA